MADIILVPANTLLDTPKDSGVQVWPANVEAFKLQLLDTQWNQAGTTVVLSTSYSWDGGVTWPYTDPNEWAQGAKARDGSAPSVAIGPFQKTVNGQVVTNNPTHARATFSAGVGTPRCGLKAVV